MLDKFTAYNSLTLKVSPEHKSLLAVSGGVDSVVLCFLFKKAGFRFGIAHCNFRLRATESDEDERFVQQLADELGVPFYSIGFDTENYARENKIGIQLAARNLRYEWLEKTRVQNGYDFLCTAHHLNDSVETLLHNLARSCGIKGLHGIPARNNHILRPLLFAQKKEIMDFAKAHQITYREDNSNSSTKYTRNYIRHKIIPQFETINPGFIKGCGNTIERLRQTELIYLEAIEGFKKQFCKEKENTLHIDLAKLSEHPAHESILFEILSTKGFNFSQVQQIFESGHTNSGRIFYSDEFEVLQNRTELIVRKKSAEDRREIYINKDDLAVKLEDGKLLIERISRPEKFDPSPYVAYLDAAKISFPLKLRHWRKGDHFQPFGMFGQTQKLKDFFINKKLSVFEKKNVKILLCNNEICWLVGYRSDHRFKLDNTSTHCYKLEWIPEK